MSTPTAPSFTNRPFAEQVSRLTRELDRAVRLDSPLIALALYKSEFVRAEAEAAVAEAVRGLGQRVERVQISPQRADLPRYLRDRPDSAETVYFVSGVQFGGGEDGLNAYRALNIRREYFIEYKLRVVFWLTKGEMVALSRHAPDFWAFRHRSVEFMEEPTAAQITKHQSALPTRQWSNDYQDLASIEAKIAYRQRLLTQLPDTPESTAARADLYYTLATLYRASQRFEEAEAAMQNAIPLAEQMEDDLLLARYDDELARIYERWGKYEKAFPFYQQALDIRKKILGDDHPTTAASLNNMGGLLESMGEYEGARPFFQQALDIYKKVLGDDHPDTAISLNNMGYLLQAMGDYEGARPFHEQALDIHKKVLGDDHPHTATSLNNMGVLLQAMGDLQGARPFVQQALDIWEAKLGANHPHTKIARNNLARLPAS